MITTQQRSDSDVFPRGARVVLTRPLRRLGRQIPEDTEARVTGSYTPPGSPMEISVRSELDGKSAGFVVGLGDIRRTDVKSYT